LGETPNYFQSRFKDKVILDPESAVLHIKEVGKEENGIYLLRVLMQNGSEKERKITLKVIGELEEPRVMLPLQDPRWATGSYGDTLGEGEKNLRTGLIYLA
jgi:hypothetical protein